MYFGQRRKAILLGVTSDILLIRTGERKSGPQEWSCRVPGKRGHHHATVEFCQLSS